MSGDARRGFLSYHRAVMSEAQQEILVRPAQQADLRGAAVLAARLVRMHHDINPGRFITAPGIEDGYQRWLGTQLADPNAVLLVGVTPDNTVVGYALGRLEPRNWMELLDAHGKLHDVFIDDSVRTRGLGARLVRGVVEGLKARGAPRVLLTTAWQNERARRLFASIGFAPTMVEMTLEWDALKPAE